MARQDIGDEDFCRALPDTDPELLKETRRAVAGFFGVPEGKLHPSDRFKCDLGCDRVEATFFASVILKVLAHRGLDAEPFQFETTGIDRFPELVAEISRVICSLEHPENEV